LQKKLIPVFHYALKPGGFLFLGTSESLSSHKELFRTVSAKHRLAQRKATAIRPPNSFSTSIQSLPPMSHKNGTSEGGEIDLHMVGQRIVLDEFSPRYAIVNDEGQIMSVSAGINEYLEPAAGTFQNHIIKLVKPSLRIALRSTFNEAKTHKRRTQNDFSVLKRAQDTGRIGITVQPMPKLGEESGLYMVVFRDLGTLTPDSVSVHHSEGGPYSSDLVDQLEKDLASARDDLDKTVQELESSNEELKSSNEELLSMNEELQSANEELEASKEEVQISNEALMRANSDLENLLASTQIATLFLDMNLRIRGFTPAISEIYRIQLSDVGREISDFTTKSIEMPAYPDPKTAFLNVPKVETEVRLPDGRIFTRRVLPYLTPERMQDGIVVTFIDVTDIRSSEERLEMMIKTSPSFMTVMHGPDFVFEKANQQYRQLVGDRDIIGKPIRQAMPEVAEQGFIEILKRVRETRVPYVGTETPIFLQRRPGGPLEKRYVDFAYTAESNDRIFTHGNDVTEKVQARMQIENERENFRNLFRQTPEMVCILSGPDHLFEFVNEAHVKALGFDATGKTVREAQPESVEVHGILDNVYRTGKTAELHEIPITLGDRLRYFNLTYAARRDNEGQINGVMILGTEITHEVVNRTELSRAREEAEKANSTKTRFLANMSHEIRTPLGAIIGFSDLLTQVFPDNETAQNYISRISRNSKQLSRLIDELLDLSKIEANCLHIDRLPMDLNPAIEDVLSAVTLQAHEKGLGFELQKLGELPDQVVTDATRFRQVLINLIGNAVKFTQKGKVTVTLRHFSKDQMDTLEVRVCDTGIGLTQEQVSRLFKPFSQADPSITRQFGGTGLGLALSRELARLLGGDIQLEKTEPNVGSVFCFTIQYPQTRIVAATTRTNPSGLLADDLKKLANRRVLIVDDSADNHVLVSLYLDRAKILHAPAYDGAEAVKMALESEFDLILMDLQMPKMDGLTAVARLRSAGYKQPIIALTAHALRIERERCLANGFNGYVTKPIDQNALLLAMIEALK
jgi:two-component system CheB/CheR fusion protein